MYGAQTFNELQFEVGDHLVTKLLSMFIAYRWIACFAVFCFMLWFVELYRIVIVNILLNTSIQLFPVAGKEHEFCIIKCTEDPGKKCNDDSFNRNGKYCTSSNIKLTCDFGFFTISEPVRIFSIERSSMMTTFGCDL